MSLSESDKIKNILVLSLSNIGDIVLTTPVVSLLRERFPVSSISVLVGPKGVSLFQFSKTVNEVIPFEKSDSWLKKIALIRELRRKKFDLVVDLRNTAIPLMIGARYRTSLRVDRSSVSMRERHLDQLRTLISFGPTNNHFHFFSDEEQQAALEKMRRLRSESKTQAFVIIAPGAGSSLKRWTLSGFVALVNHFIETSYPVVLVGTRDEMHLGVELEQQVIGAVANLIGLLSLRELAGLVDRASLIVANDSAVMHLAHELNRPTVSIFGPTSEERYGQRGENRRAVRLHLDCTPCEQAQCRLIRRACLDDLPVDAVIRAADKLLNHVHY